jgi:hypothetical protein
MSSDSFVGRPKGLDRLEAGLDILRERVNLPAGTIDFFDDGINDPENFWLMDEEPAVAALPTTLLGFWNHSTLGPAIFKIC